MKPYLEDADFTLYNGDVKEMLAGLPDESVHCVVTSPPYWGLRDYGTGSWDGGDPNCDHIQGRPGAGRADGIVDERMQRNRDGAGAFSSTCKCGARRTDNQLGLEPTPDAYVQNMVAVFREVRRVLRRDGTCWLNIGDSYANNGAGGDTRSGFNSRYFGTDIIPGKQAAAVGQYPAEARNHGLKPKDLCGIPWRLAFALQADGWYLRADIIWSKPNPMPESVTDRPTKAHEYVFLLTRSPRYFFDQEAVREPAEYGRRIQSAPFRSGAENGDGHRSGGGSVTGADPSAGRNVRSVWEIATQPYAEAHFATFPEALVERCIRAGTSERGACPVCGAPWERETETTYEPSKGGGKRGRVSDAHDRRGHHNEGVGERARRIDTTTGWKPSCLHYHHIPEIVPATVLDPFMGSGTTALVSRRLERKAVGVELNRSYCELAARRLQQLSLLAT